MPRLTKLPRVTQSSITRAVEQPRLTRGGREPKVSTSNVALPRSKANFRNAEVTPADFGAEAFRSIGQLGKQLSKNEKERLEQAAIAEAKLERELIKGREAAFKTNAISALKQSSDNAEQELQEKVGPGLSGYVPLLQAVLENKTGQLLTEAPTPEAFDSARAILWGIIDRRLGRARVVQRKAEVSKATDDLGDVIGVAVAAVALHPDQLVDRLREGMEAILRGENSFLAGVPARTDEIKDNFKEQIYSAHVKARILKEPVAVKRELDAGIFNKVLSGDQILRFKNAARTEIGKRERAVKAQEKERIAELGKLVKDFSDARIRGFQWRGPLSEEELGEQIKGTEHEAEFNLIQGATRALAEFNLLSPFEQRQVINRLRSGAKSGREAKVFDLFVRAHEATKKGLEDDAYSFAVEQGGIPPPPPLDLNNPTNLDSAVLRIQSRDAAIATAIYGVPVSPLSEVQADQLKASMEGMTARNKVGVLRSLTQGLRGRDIKLVASQFAKKDPNVLALAMGLSVDAPEVAARIFQGQDVLRDNPKVNPTGADLGDLTKHIESAIGEAYQHSPEEFAAVREAALAVYALNSWQARDIGRALVGRVEIERLNGAIRAVTGGILTIDRVGWWTGSYTIQAPVYGATEDDWSRLIKEADFSGAKNASPVDIQKHGIFESVGDGRYIIRIGPQYIQGEQGPFILDFSNVRRRDLPSRLTDEVSAIRRRIRAETAKDVPVEP